MTATLATSHVRRTASTALALAIATVALNITVPLVPAGAVTSAAPRSHHESRSTSTEAFGTDVYQVGGNGNLIHVDPRTTVDSTQLFNLAGEPLNLTWGQWRATSASSVARPGTMNGGAATDFRITLGGLVPGGTYSLFYRTFGPESRNPVCPAVETLIELTALRPDRQVPAPASFVADSGGGGQFHGRVPGDLLAAQSLTITVIYEFGGQTFGPVPNRGDQVGCQPSFGVDSLEQLLIFQNGG